jgi:transposase
MNAFFLGMDVSKGYADCVLLDDHRNVVIENFQIDDTNDGHHALLLHLQEVFAKHPETVLSVGLESTGGLEDNWYSFLLGLADTHPIRVARLNPRGVMHHGKAGLNRVTTDKTSARSIAEYLITHPEKARYNVTDDYSSLRKQWKFVRLLTMQRVQLLNQLNAFLYGANPGILLFWKEDIAASLLRVLVKYPLAKDLARARISTLCRMPYVSTARARELVALAKRSVAGRQDEAMAHTISSLAEHILSLGETIAWQTDRLIADCPFPQITILTSFKGIGVFSAIGLFLAIGNIERFASPKKLASFLGVHPVFKHSGDGSSQARMSKQGSPEVRRILYMVAMVAVVHNPLIKDIYQAAQERGMAKRAALGLVMHKIVRIIYGMLKHHTPFDPEVDRSCRARQYELALTTPASISQTDRRFQAHDANAPISRQQHKKRKEQAESQNDGASFLAGSSTHSFPSLGTRKVGTRPQIDKQKKPSKA